VLVDTLGLWMSVRVHPANVQERDGGLLLFDALADRLALLHKLFAAGASQGPVLSKALAKIRPALKLESIKRTDSTPGFVVVPKRWIVERTLAWLNRCRRLAQDFENRIRTAIAFVQLASMRLMLRKLCNPS